MHPTDPARVNSYSVEMWDIIGVTLSRMICSEEEEEEKEGEK
jgi:hypothetical protein